MAFALTPEREQQVDDIITRYPTRRAALIPVLWVCQKQNSWISPDVIDYVSARLDISAAAVKGVVTFYTMFFDKPVGENVVWVCRTIGCDIRGGKTIQEHLEKRLGCHAGETTKDGKFTLLRAECLAACGQAPMMQINDEYFENLDVKAVDRIIDGIVAGDIKPPRISVMPAPAPAQLTAPSTRTSIPMSKPTSSAPAGPASGSTKLPSIPPPSSVGTFAKPTSAAMSAQPAKPASVPPPAKTAEPAKAAEPAKTETPSTADESADAPARPDSSDKAEVS